jgi:hypothetical protein
MMRRLALLKVAFSRRLNESLRDLMADCLRAAQAQEPAPSDDVTDTNLRLELLRTAQRPTLGARGDEPLDTLGLIGPSGEGAKVWPTVHVTCHLDGDQVQRQIRAANDALAAEFRDSISKVRG